jgi:hypothetical protein
MNTDYTIKDDPAAVLRALADGRKVRDARWDSSFISLGGRGYVCYETGEQYRGSFNGTWHVLKERDMGADPRVGDKAEAALCGGVIVVDAVTPSFVYCIGGDGDRLWHFAPASWLRFIRNGEIVPVEYASEDT